MHVNISANWPISVILTKMSTPTPNLVLSQDVVGKTHDCLLVPHDRSTGRTRQSGQDDLPALFIIA